MIASGGMAPWPYPGPGQPEGNELVFSRKLQSSAGWAATRGESSLVGAFANRSDRVMPHSKAFPKENELYEIYD